MPAPDSAGALAPKRTHTIDPADWAADLLIALDAIGDALPPLYGPQAALAEAALVTLDGGQYSRACELGFAGNIGDLAFEPVIFDAGGRFRLAKDQTDQRNAAVAFLVGMADSFGVLSDIAAWEPETGRTATLFGLLGTLGLETLDDPGPKPPMVHENVGDWLRAGRRGLVIIDDRLAARELAGQEIVAANVEAGRRLRGRLKGAARIFVEEAAT